MTRATFAPDATAGSPATEPVAPTGTALALDALRRGMAIAITDGAATLVVRAVETALPLDAPGPLDILISGERAQTLRLTNHVAAVGNDGQTALRVTGLADLAAARALSDPALDLAHPLRGPYPLGQAPAAHLGAALLHLLRLAGLLPAAIITTDPPVLTVTAAAAMALSDAAQLVLAASARLPVHYRADGEIGVFRSPELTEAHVALTLGQRDGRPPLVRLHSECLTGDVFGSLKCDCGPQLDAALAAMAEASWGVLLYLRQEGRGIGLVNKMRAYQLQDQGFDTVDANIRLGFPVEARDFAIAAEMLRQLNIPSVRLMTNNPEKVDRLRAAGIDVVERVPHIMGAGDHNARYLATKRTRTGHLL